MFRVIYKTLKKECICEYNSTSSNEGTLEHSTYLDRVSHQLTSRAIIIYRYLPGHPHAKPEHVTGDRDPSKRTGPPGGVWHWPQTPPCLTSSTCHLETAAQARQARGGSSHLFILSSSPFSSLLLSFLGGQDKTGRDEMWREGAAHHPRSWTRELLTDLI